MITILVCGGRGFGNMDEVPLLFPNGPLNKELPIYKEKKEEYDYIVSKLNDFIIKNGFMNEFFRIYNIKIISGGATGADTVAIDYAKGANINNEIYKADWKTHGKAAGPIRNAKMLEKENVDYVFAFPGGRGTADMVKKANKKGIPVLDYREVYYDNDNII